MKVVVFSLFLSGFLVCGVGFDLAYGQGSVSVGLLVSEDTGGIFESNFRSALRSLGDIEIMDSVYNADIILKVNAICESDCQDTSVYAVSVTVEKPLDRADVYNIMQVPGEVNITSETLEKIEETTELYSVYTIMESSWVALWGRLKYEQSIRELIYRIDTECFQTVRLDNQWFSALLSDDTETSDRLENQLKGRKCR